jgi:hypothetical protein
LARQIILRCFFAATDKENRKEATVIAIIKIRFIVVAQLTKASINEQRK